MFSIRTRAPLTLVGSSAREVRSSKRRWGSATTVVGLLGLLRSRHCLRRKEAGTGSCTDHRDRLGVQLARIPGLKQNFADERDLTGVVRCEADQPGGQF
ncbi:MAG: hypothetical protein JWO99_655 [Candidatus Saccharibacteria bacterium]|nr:hypothetical protein [Candidatus Saccharibacteria bacterium]